MNSPNLLSGMKDIEVSYPEFASPIFSIDIFDPVDESARFSRLEYTILSTFSDFSNLRKRRRCLFQVGKKEEYIALVGLLSGNTDTLYKGILDLSAILVN